MNNGFLQNVAGYILGKYADGLRNCCMVFPNQRSIVYFREAVRKQRQGKVIWLPRLCTIDEFMHQLGNMRVASQVTLLTMLYKVHQDVTRGKSGENGDVSFDRFYPWALTILADFDDIDKYMVNAHDLLRNIQDIKDLDSYVDYLSDEQKKAVLDFFHTSFADDLSQTNSKIKKRYLDIWHNLWNMYSEFNSRLSRDRIQRNGLPQGRSQC